MRFVLIDYHKGNIKSVERGLVAQGADVLVSDSPSDVVSADAIVLPGVGAFTDAMRTLNELGITPVLKERVSAGVPFLGICLGQHLMFEGGTEHAEGLMPTSGLGFLPGVVDRIPKEDDQGNTYKVPHVGWNSLEVPAGKGSGFSSELLKGIEPGEFFYFTHSYMSPLSEFDIATTTHSVALPAAVQKDNAFGVQFHPEKSSAAGAKLLGNFIKLAANCQ